MGRSLSHALSLQSIDALIALHLTISFELRPAVPDGKPTIESATNTSSSAIRLQWAPPSRNTIHGEFLGYKIKYRKHGPVLGIEKEITLRDPDLRVSDIAFPTLPITKPFVKRLQNIFL